MALNTIWSTPLGDRDQPIRLAEGNFFALTLDLDQERSFPHQLFCSCTRRVLELLVETITVSKDNVEVRFRANGIEQVVEELEPIGAESND